MHFVMPVNRIFKRKLIRCILVTVANLDIQVPVKEDVG